MDGGKGKEGRKDKRNEREKVEHLHSSMDGQINKRQYIIIAEAHSDMTKTANVQIKS